MDKDETNVEVHRSHPPDESVASTEAIPAVRAQDKSAQKQADPIGAAYWVGWKRGGGLACLMPGG